ncbi:MAG TPA: 1-acyl-sn-glycerol-3-phosphate acyltransferase [Tenuifilaceae bacterium]|nr:1-acyl-sn-glycerol-3-phosphate acyltransferase [Tenuifilaceae bacterium]HRX68670.1 1-acyl-sn-glycerol-3-phosphate acyltransferase [Tenuifilaceae bacterium]
MPISRENIEKWSNSYWFLKHYVDFGFKFYFKTTVAGFENIPKKGTFIFTPNHQNALMDALGILCLKPWQPVYLARADIFNNPFICKVLTFLKIMPVYRFRDGFENLNKNDEIFKKTMDVLRNGNGLVILPEGNHGDEKRLRPLKKGVARIAFQAESIGANDLDIKIIPVGMDYTHYVHVGSELHIRFGSAINVKPLLVEYNENPAKAYNSLLELLSAGIKKEMIHITDEKYYPNYLTILDVFTRTYLEKQKLHNTHENRVDAQQLFISKIDELKENDFDSFLLLIANTIEINNIAKKTKINLKSFPSRKSDYLQAMYRFVLLILSLPLFVYSLINNIIPILTPYIFTNRKIKDLQFHSSLRFGFGLVLSPIVHAIQLLVFIIVSKSLPLSLAYASSLPLTVFLYFGWRDWFFSSVNSLRELALKITKSKQLKRGVAVHELLVKRMWDIVQSKTEEEYLPNYLSE